MRACVPVSSSIGSAGAPPRVRDPAAEFAARKVAQREALALLLGTDRTKARVALQTLEKIAGNILSEPAQPKYRTLKVDNATIKEKVGPPGPPGARL